MKKVITSIIMIILLSCLASAMTLYVRPTSGGSPLANTSFYYSYVFTNNYDCTNAIAILNSSVTTNSYGIGAIELNTDVISQSYYYMCEYRDGNLRKIFNTTNLYAKNLFVSNSIKSNDWTNISITSSQINNAPWLIATADNCTDGEYSRFNGTKFVCYADEILLDGETDPVASPRINNLNQTIISINTSSNIKMLGFNTTAELDNKYYSSSNPSGYITDGNSGWDNSYGFITGYTETDPTFVSNNGSIWSGINSKLSSNGGTISGNLIVMGNFSTLGSVANLTVVNIITNGSIAPDYDSAFDLGSSLNRWNKIYGVTIEADINASRVQNAPWITSYSETDSIATPRINSINESLISVNTTGNIKMLGFNTTAELDSKYYLASNPNNYITDGNTNWDNSYGFVTANNYTTNCSISGTTTKTATCQRNDGYTYQFSWSDMTGTISDYSIIIDAGQNLTNKAGLNNAITLSTSNITSGTFGNERMGLASINNQSLNTTNSGTNGQVLTKNGNQFTWSDDQLGSGASNYGLILDAQNNLTNKIGLQNSTTLACQNITGSASNLCTLTDTNSGGDITGIIGGLGINVTSGDGPIPTVLINKTYLDTIYYSATNPSGYITDGNSGWDNSYGFITNFQFNISNGTASSQVSNNTRINITGGTGIAVRLTGTDFTISSTLSLTDTNDTERVNSINNSLTTQTSRIDSVNSTIIIQTARIDNLNATKANISHTHSANDITSGAFGKERIAGFSIDNSTINSTNNGASGQYAVLANDGRITWTSVSLVDTNDTARVNSINSSLSVQTSRIDSINTTVIAVNSSNNIAGLGFLTSTQTNTIATNLAANISSVNSSSLQISTAISTYVNRSLWTTIDNYPAACNAGQFVTQIGDTLTCSTPTDLNNYTSSISINGRALTLSRSGMTDLTTNLVDNSILLNFLNISGTFSNSQVGMASINNNSLNVTNQGSSGQVLTYGSNGQLTWANDQTGAGAGDGTGGWLNNTIYSYAGVVQVNYLNITSLSAASCDVKADVNGTVYCGTDATGGAGSGDGTGGWTNYSNIIITNNSDSVVKITGALCLNAEDGTHIAPCRERWGDQENQRKFMSIQMDPFLVSGAETGEYGHWGWTSAVLGTGTDITDSDSPTVDALGTISLGSGTLATSSARLSTGTGGIWLNGSSGITGWFTRVYFDNIGRDAQNYTTYIGMSDGTLNLMGTDAIIAMYNSSESQYWQFATCSNSACTKNITTHQVNATKWYDIEAQVYNASLAVLYINGINEVNLTNNIPSGSTRAFPAGRLQINKTAGTTERRMYVDYYGVYRVFQAPRW